MMKFFRMFAITVLLLGVAGSAFVYSGLYPMGADVPHNRLTYWLLETLRERSIERAAKDIAVPPLDDPELLLSGGPDYNEMCAICHLKPGRIRTDMSMGLYPAPPDLTAAAGEDEHGHDHGAGNEAAHQFWIIKHGIKASGMPAWGITHDDQRIWAMVAFLQKLPQLTPQQYRILTARTQQGDHHKEHDGH